MKKIEMVGKTFGRLYVLDDSIRNRTNNIMCKCRCICGKTTIVAASTLRSGKSKSCGCLHNELLSLRKFIHGKSLSPTYRVWASMKGRCYNKKNVRFKDYGGRGIKVCDRWKNSFKNFYKDMGDKPKNKSIDRINNNGDYSPKNCRWATYKEQSTNKRTNVYIRFNNQNKTVKDWSKFLGINYSTLRNRLYRSHFSIKKSFNPCLYK
jgi:hypothetical protein